jgi:hypothetical protein
VKADDLYRHGPTIFCALCNEFESENRDDFDWEEGAPICVYCMAFASGEEIMAVGFEAAIDALDRKAERGGQA